MKITKNARRKSYSFFAVSLEGMKEINENFGRPQGDNALRDVSEILKTTTRRGDFVARNDAGKFVIIAVTDKIEIINDRIANKIKEFNMRKTCPYTLVLNCGNGLYKPEDTRTPQEFLSFVYERRQK